MKENLLSDPFHFEVVSEKVGCQTGWIIDLPQVNRRQSQNHQARKELLESRKLTRCLFAI